MREPYWARGDIDGFFGLFVDNLVQLMLIAALCGAVCGFPSDLVTGTILPGAAVSILFGNAFYTWQARRLARKEGRADVTALPYGINTPTVVAYVFFIMGPVYRETGDSGLAWQAGLFACFLSGVMETVGAFVAEPLRRATPRAALLSALAGVAITFIAMGFVFQIFASPAVALVPAVFVLMTYAGRLRLPFGLPGGLVAVALGTAIAWAMGPAPAGGAEAFRFCPPRACAGDLFGYLFSDRGWRYLSVIFPMGLFNIIGSLQNLESAEAAGDRFETRPSLLANGLGSLLAALLGSGVERRQQEVFHLHRGGLNFLGGVDVAFAGRDPAAAGVGVQVLPEIRRTGRQLHALRLDRLFKPGDIERLGALVFQLRLRCQRLRPLGNERGAHRGIVRRGIIHRRFFVGRSQASRDQTHVCAHVRLERRDLATLLEQLQFVFGRKHRQIDAAVEGDFLLVAIAR